MWFIGEGGGGGDDGGGDGGGDDDNDDGGKDEVKVDAAPAADADDDTKSEDKS